MTKRVLIIGGYGNFGSYISKTLAKEDLKIIIAGRSREKCQSFIEGIKYNIHAIEYFVFDITKEIPLNKINPDIIIHTSGPFQGQGYDVAKACIDYGCHYIDLADAREFVTKIDELNNQALSKNVSIISGASSVPCLSSAVIDKYRSEFKEIDSIEYAIATAQQTNRGYATTASILTYTGKPYRILQNEKFEEVYGWQDFYLHKYPELGWRGLCNCDIPDMEIFPKHYPNVKSFRFSAGTEIMFMQIGLWLLSWLVRGKVLRSLKFATRFFLRIARMFDWMGTNCSGFHMKFTGVDNLDKQHTKTIYIIAKEAHGPYIPCIPAILLAKRIANAEFVRRGAFPCVSLISLNDYMSELSSLSIELVEI